MMTASTAHRQQWQPHLDRQRSMSRVYASFSFPGALLLVALLVCKSSTSDAFVPSFSSNPLAPISTTRIPKLPSKSPSNTILYGGVGVANTYSWSEEQFEIDLKIKVPPQTSAKDIKFKCSSESIDLRLLNNNDESGEEKILLDGSRKMRGKICVDGTFWSIEGPTNKERDITITIEKHFVPISSSGGTQTYDTLTDFDWGGIYPNDEEEVSSRKYDEAEELNVREYAAKLGVDIDNIDMSKVDKSMFGGGLGKDSVAPAGEDEENGEASDDNDATSNNNKQGFHFNIEQATLDQLTKSGLAKEVVQQGDGMEYELGADGTLNEDNIFSMLGKDVSSEELREAGLIVDGLVGGDNNAGNAAAVPTMPWQTVPVEEAPGYQKTYDTSNSLAGSDGMGIIESEIVEREISSSPTSSNDDDGTGVVDVVSERTEVVSDAKNEIGNEDDKDLQISDDVTKNSNDGEDAATSNESRDMKPSDPIDLLTVVKLKEILRGQGLKVSGTKQVLRDRLRSHVNTLLEEE